MRDATIGHDRHDWMLLLPATVALPHDDAIVIAGSDERAQTLVDRGVTSRWRRAAHDHDQSTLIVAWADATCSLERIAGHVSPDGVLVAEIERRRRGRRLLSAAAVERRLGRCGLQVHSIHLVEPSFGTAGRHLPADAPEALRWYLRTLFVAATPAMRTARTAMSLVAATPLARTAIGVTGRRLLVIARTADVASDAAGERPANAPNGLPDCRPGDRTLLLTSGYDAGSRAVALLFGHRQRRPRSVIKVASGPDNAESTLREHARLVELHGSLPPALTHALPMPLVASSCAGRVACAQTCAAGPSMSSLVGGWGRWPGQDRANLRSVSEWLTGLARATLVRAGDGRSAWMDVFGETARTVDVPPSVGELLSTAESAAVRSGLGREAVYQHYDTGPWNVHLQPDGPFLIDWESDRLRPADSLGPPLADTLYLATYWYFLMSGARSAADEEHALARLFVEPAALDHDVLAVRRIIDRSLLDLGLERPCVPPALVALWAERALYTHRRRLSLGAASPPAETRPLAYLRTLATGPTVFAEQGWWSFPIGTNVATKVASRPARPGRRPSWRRGALDPVPPARPA